MYEKVNKSNLFLWILGKFFCFEDAGYVAKSGLDFQEKDFMRQILRKLKWNWRFHFISKVALPKLLIFDDVSFFGEATESPDKEWVTGYVSMEPPSRVCLGMK